MESIYLDYQATAPLDSQVLNVMRPYFAEAFGNPHSSEHARGWRASQAVERASAEVAELIGSDADEILFVSGATEANNMALLGLGRRARDQKRKRIVLAPTEHKCVLEVCRILEQQLGFSISFAPVDNEGKLDPAALRDQMADDVLLVSAMAVNNEIGTIQDIRSIGLIAAEFGSYFHCDAAQAPCAMDVSRLAEYADFVSLSGHKVYGPMGVGALYIKRELQDEIEPLIYGGGQQRGLRSGTLPTALCVGFGAAARLISGDKGASERASIKNMRDRLLKKLTLLPIETWLNGPSELSKRHPGNINIGFQGVLADDLLSRLQPLISASTGSACTSGIPEPSHVLRSIGLTDADASSSVRFCVGRHTTEDEIDRAAQIIGEKALQIHAEGEALFA